MGIKSGGIKYALENHTFWGYGQFDEKINSNGSQLWSEVTPQVGQTEQAVLRLFQTINTSWPDFDTLGRYSPAHVDDLFEYYDVHANWGFIQGSSVLVISVTTTFPEYLLDLTIRQSKLFVVQTLLEIAEQQNYWGFRGSNVSNKSLEFRDESWIIKAGRTSLDVVFKAETLASSLLMNYLL